MSLNQPQPSSNANTEEKLAHLIDTYGPRLHAVASPRLNRDHHRIQEAIHKTYIEYLSKPRDGVRNVFAYLCRILLRVCGKMTRRKQLKTEDFETSDELGTAITAAWASPHADLENADLSNRLIEKIEKLPQHQRDVIHLRYFLNYRHEEIAATLKIKLAAVGRHHRAALDRLREMLKEGDL